MTDTFTHQAAQPWSKPTEAILAELDSDADEGLTSGEARHRLQRFGPNSLAAVKPRSWFAVLAAQFRGMVVALLTVAALLAFAFGDVAEGSAIIAVLVINAIIGFATELRAVRSMEALSKLATVDTLVRRDGTAVKVPAEQLVPGDIVLLEAGDRVTADLRILNAAKLSADEAALTGESAPVSKSTVTLEAETPVMERRNMLFKGATVVRGSGVAVVTATGTATELGHIAEWVSSAEPEATPLEKRLDTLGRRVVWFTLALSALIAAGGVLAGRDLRLAIEVAIALAVAAIPEGLPIVATIALARGMHRMARRNALIRRLSAVETLGATGIILTDKTGTLTENRMTVTRVLLAETDLEVSGAGLSTDGEFRPDGNGSTDSYETLLDELLTSAALCNNASVRLSSGGQADPAGDPTEVALLVAAAKRGLLRDALLETMPEIREEPFDPDTKAMATFHRVEDRIQVFVKGAPERVLECCTCIQTLEGPRPLDETQRSELTKRAFTLARQGLRTLAIAGRWVDAEHAAPYEELTLFGIVGLLDPAREGVREAIEQCHGAGIRVVMVTGDHVATAHSIARRIGLLDESAAEGAVRDASDWGDERVELDEDEMEPVRVFARATPRQKLELIARYQAQDNVVAMTGDGVNDAPALKKADIGVAMGIRGTQVAKEASAMVLQDDEFRTIVTAIEQGRAIYANLRKFVVYLLSCNISELLVIGIATLAGAPLPLLPLQILFLNLVTDVFPALALGVGQGPKNLMQRPPRPASEQILERRHWAQIMLQALVIAVAVLGAMGLTLAGPDGNHREAVTVSFLTLAMAQMWHVFNMHERDSARIDNEITRNPWIWAALVVCSIFLGVAMTVPGLRSILWLTPLAPASAAIALAMSFVPLLLGPATRALAKRWEAVGSEKRWGQSKGTE